MLKMMSHVTKRLSSTFNPGYYNSPNERSRLIIAYISKSSSNCVTSRILFT